MSNTYGTWTAPSARPDARSPWKQDSHAREVFRGLDYLHEALSSFIDTDAADGLFVGGAVKDDVAFGFGSDSDYWVTYNTTGTQWELWSTNVDGGGSDGVVIAIPDGTDDVQFAGGLSTDGNSTPTEGITTNLLGVGAALSGASRSSIYSNDADSDPVQFVHQDNASATAPAHKTQNDAPGYPAYLGSANNYSFPMGVTAVLTGIDSTNQLRITITRDGSNGVIYATFLVRARLATDADLHGMYRIIVSGARGMGSNERDIDVSVLYSETSSGDWVAITTGDVALDSISSADVIIDIDNPAAETYSYDVWAISSLGFTKFALTEVAA